jgi:two-component system LytT family response regulator
MSIEQGIRVLIVDDEPLARRGVLLRLADQRDIEVVGECSNGKEALQRISDLGPDLIFLDIQMPRMNGIDVLRHLSRKSMPVVIFLTAYDEYALAAFEVQALDYLLKPIDDSRFRAALERAKHLIRLKQQDELYERLQKLISLHEEQKSDSFIKRFAVRSGERVGFIHVGDINWIEAAGDYAELHTTEKTYLIRESLSSLENRLHPDHFLRIHRSAIVRLDRIVRITAAANRDGFLTLRDGTSLRYSRSYSRPLRASLRTVNYQSNRSSGNVGPG